MYAEDRGQDRINYHALPGRCLLAAWDLLACTMDAARQTGSSLACQITQGKEEKRPFSSQNCRHRDENHTARGRKEERDFRKRDVDFDIRGANCRQLTANLGKGRRASGGQ